MTTLLLLSTIAVTVTTTTELAADIAIEMMALPALVVKMPKDTLAVITGNLLGDGCLRRSGKKRDGQPTGNARFEMNKASASFAHHYALFLKYYKEFSGVGFRKNTHFHGQLQMIVTQWHIFTLSTPLFSELHSIWYTWDPIIMKYVKVLPLDIAEMFTPLSLAQWIMDDGYFTDSTVILCTDNFTFEETQRLVDLLKSYGLSSGIITQKGKPRLRLYRGSVPLLIDLVKEHMHPDFMYKLGL